MDIQRLKEDPLFAGDHAIQRTLTERHAHARGPRPGARFRTNQTGEHAFPEGLQGITFGSFVLLPAQQLLLEGERTVRLGSRALCILIALVQRAGEIVSKDELLAAAWPGLRVDDTNLRVHIAAVRRALGDGRYIKTVPLRGYCFVARVQQTGPTEMEVDSTSTPTSPTRAPSPVEGTERYEPAESLSQRLANHASLLRGLVGAKGAAGVTAREAALLGLQIIALDAALTEILGRSSSA